MPSSREDVDRDSSWNQWLRNEIHTLFIEALEVFKVKLKVETSLEKTKNLATNQVRHKPTYTVTDAGEALSFGFKKKRYCTICVVKTKALISCAVTAQMMYAFVFFAYACFFAYAGYWFSDAMAQVRIKLKQKKTYENQPHLSIYHIYMTLMFL